MASSVGFEGPVPSGPGSQPFGTAFIADVGIGVDLGAHDYVEEEYLVRGTANLYAYNSCLLYTSRCV